MGVAAYGQEAPRSAAACAGAPSAEAPDAAVQAEACGAVRPQAAAQLWIPPAAQAGRPVLAAAGAEAAEPDGPAVEAAAAELRASAAAGARPQGAARQDAEVQPPVAVAGAPAGRVARQPAVRPSAAPAWTWCLRRRPAHGPGQQRSRRPGPWSACLRIASPSGRKWQAARGGDLSWRWGSRKVLTPNGVRPCDQLPAVRPDCGDGNRCEAIYFNAAST